MKQVFIIGTSHRFQVNDSRSTDEEIKALKDFLRNECVKRQSRAIAEEMSDEVVKQYGQKDSVCRQVADELMITHRYCDPNSSERRERGIQKESEVRIDLFDKLSPNELEKRVESEHSKREKFWLDELKSLSSWPVLFVCGSNHAIRFRDLLGKSGIRAEVVIEDWKL